MAHTNATAQDATSVDVKSLAFLNQMAALVPGIIYVFNHQTLSNEYANRSIAQMLGYGPQEIQSMGEELLPTIIHPEDFDRIADNVASLQTLGSGEQAVWEYRAIARDGRTVWLRSVETVFCRAPDGGVLRTIGIALDITTQKTAEMDLMYLNGELEKRVTERTQELAALNEQLEQRVEDRTRELSRAREELNNLNDVAINDLKGPINNIAGLAQMLEEARDFLPPEHAEALGWMQTVCDQATRKLDALVCIAQANAVPQDQFVDVHLQAVIERVLASLHLQIDHARASVETELHQPTVHFLPQQVESILQAIVINALSCRAPGCTPRLTIRSALTGNAVELSVADGGREHGSEQDSKQDFGLFQRAHVEPEGTGVPLYTICRIMRRIGGNIDVSSRPDEGTVFTLMFPLPRSQPVRP